MDYKKYLFSYFIICFIVLSGIVVFYMSCKSKSPTETNALSNDTLETQGVNNTTQTTTSSSTTSTIKPGNAPTNTTTLITSRNLTTTSTSTTSTSTSTTSTSTTSRNAPLLQWCTFYVRFHRAGGSAEYYVDNGDVITEHWDYGTLWIYPKIKNVGTDPAENVSISIQNITKNTHRNIVHIYKGIILYNTTLLGTIPHDGTCVVNIGVPLAVKWGDPQRAQIGDECKITVIESFSHKTFSLKFRYIGD